MQTCENCIHHDLCSEYYYTGELCAMFKNKLKFIELPCPIGTTVYMVVHAHNTWDNYEYKDVVEMPFKLDMLQSFNKRFFLTQKEAERRLEEML